MTGSCVRLVKWTQPLPGHCRRSALLVTFVTERVDRVTVDGPALGPVEFGEETRSFRDLIRSAVLYALMSDDAWGAHVVILRPAGSPLCSKRPTCARSDSWAWSVP
jgi:hypothetical protein